MSSRDELKAVGVRLRQQNWADQSHLDLVPVGDFSFDDQMLDMSFTLGKLPQRVQEFHGEALDNYLRVTRGRSGQAGAHRPGYLPGDRQGQGRFRPAGAAGQAADCLCGTARYALATHDVDWVQIDEPILVTELDSDWRQASRTARDQLKMCNIKILLATFLGQLQDNAGLVASLPVAGVHVDAINDRNGVAPLIDLLRADRVLSLGVINGRNIWKTDLGSTLDWLEPLARKLGDRLWIAPSRFRLHVPLDLDSEDSLDPEIKV